MDTLAIQVNDLGKRYRIGAAAPYHTLRESLVRLARAPLKRLRRGAAGVPPFIWALQGVSFRIDQGEAVGIIGRNGAGKTTLLKLLARITAPTQGSLDLWGRVGSLLEVGAGFHPELTGRENVYLNGAILGMKRAEIDARFDEIVAFSEIEPFIDTPVKFYSSGMFMRLAFSVAAHLEPEVLLVDEVLAVGDAAFQKKCLGKMDSVARGGRTVLFVSHNLNAVEELCSRCILLEGGRLVEDSRDVRAVIRRYLAGAGDAVRMSEWRNDGTRYPNPYFKPLRMALTGANGQPLDQPARNDAEMWVEIEGEIEQLDTALNIGYALYDEENRLLYWSYHTDGAEADWPKLAAGRVHLRGELPGRLLNEGAYRLELIAGLHFRQWVLEPGVSAPSINLEIQGGLSDSPFWIAKRPGILAPALRWERP